IFDVLEANGYLSNKAHLQPLFEIFFHQFPKSSGESIKDGRLMLKLITTFSKIFDKFPEKTNEERIVKETMQHQICFQIFKNIKLIIINDEERLGTNLMIVVALLKLGYYKLCDSENYSKVVKRLLDHLLILKEKLGEKYVVPNNITESFVI